MPTLFHQRFEQRCQPAIERAFGLTVTVKRGAQTTADFTATFVQQMYEAVEFETGLVVKHTSHDFFLPADDLVLDGATFEPLAGMLLIEGTNTYEIMPIAGRPAAELQPGGYRWLVHTKLVT